MKGVSRETPIGTIYKGAIPFIAVTILTLVGMFCVPENYYMASDHFVQLIKRKGEI